MNTDGREMEAGLELNRKIAMLLGYRVEKDDNRYYLVRPDGRYVWGAGTLSAEKRNVAGGRGNPDDFFDPTGDADVPDWSGSVDAALSLIPDDANVTLESMRNPRAWNAIVTGLNFSIGSYGHAESPALAIVGAWLAWKESEEE